MGGGGGGGGVGGVWGEGGGEKRGGGGVGGGGRGGGGGWGGEGGGEGGTRAGVVKIAGEGMMDSHGFQYLTELSDDIGARVTGSPAERKAEEWGVAKMKAIGLENVHTEKYQLWRGWARGMAQGELLEPIRKPLHVDAMGWTGSTQAGGVEGEVATVNLFDIEGEVK